MRKFNLHTDTVARLSAEEPVLCVETVDAATWLTPDPPKRRRTGKEPALTADAALDELFARVAALVALGSDTGLRAVALAVGMLTHPEESYENQTAGRAEQETVLARTVRTVAGVALAWERPEALLPLLPLRHDGEALLVSSSLRHLRAQEKDAVRSYDSHLAWWTECAWRSSVPQLATEERTITVMAEAELLLSCIAAADGGTAYCASMGSDRRAPERRLVARLRDSRQAPALARLVDCDVDEVLTAYSAAYGRLEFSHPGGRPGRVRPLVIE